MTTLPLASNRDERASRSVRVGVAFAATIALFYALCTLVWLVAPGPFLAFMNELFHGLDFTKLGSAAPFSWSGFVVVLFILAGWSFLAGTFYGWLCQRLNG